MKPIAEEPVRTHQWAPGSEYAGRRLRVFARLVSLRGYTTEADGHVLLFGGGLHLSGFAAAPSYGEALKAAESYGDSRDLLAALPLASYRRSITTLAQLPPWHRDERDPEVPVALQDLANAIRQDVHEACAAFNDPTCWYPGVDVGIPPVSDAHVELVIAALQRELRREPRGGRPPAPLADLPWRIQRALAERRRLRFAEYGIGQAEWEAGTWSLWNVRDDPDWLPRTGSA